MSNLVFTPIRTCSRLPANTEVATLRKMGSKESTALLAWSASATGTLKVGGE
tara:strand:+ start:719 stop:874 length:156 start_codon:yes stop_codon:yes gene_type:complete